VSTVFSILIGRVSTEDSARILESLDALRAQEGALAYEVIIVDRRLDAITERIRADYPEAQTLPCAPGTALPEMRALALEKARGDFVAVTEDHCIPPSNWLASIYAAFQMAPAGTMAVGGAIVNGVCDRALDWATFLCEYSAFVGPVRDGPATSLPGMNVAYRRSALIALDPAVLRSGFWETTAHPLFLAKGYVLYLSDAVRIMHKKKFSFPLFAQQRFLYSRYYAGLRFTREQLAARWMMCVLTLGLPPLLLIRIARNVFGKKQLLTEFARALPYLTVFVLIWAAGEMVGYAAGPGDALSRIE
jgi:hypothetical protein